jgi:hypothetical protein
MARAVRMYRDRDRVAEGDISQLGARRKVGELSGINPATLWNWIRREEWPGGSKRRCRRCAVRAGRASSSRTLG